MAVADIVQLFVAVVTEALPITVVWYLGELIVGTFLGSAFGGKLSFKVL